MKDTPDIKDYLHLYLGCDVQIISIQNPFLPEAAKAGFYGKVGDNVTLDPFRLELTSNNVLTIKPILRPLSDMTEKETIEFGIESGFDENCEKFRWLLSKHFDLFMLIEAGLAIDKTTLKL